MSQSEIAMTLKLEAGKKYRTRGGDEVEVLRTDLKGTMPVVGVVTFASDGRQAGETWYSNGESYLSVNGTGSLDLISEIKPKRVVWLNVYSDDDGGFYYDSRAEADASADSARIACIRVEFEKGQFDE